MELALLGKAVAMFAATNIDDMVVLTLFFGRGGRNRRNVLRVVSGQYLGFLAIVVVSVLGAWGASLLPERALPYLGLLPLGLGIRAGWQVWRSTRQPGGADDYGVGRTTNAWEVAAVTFANGGDNIGVYVPVFAVSGVASTTWYIVIFLICMAFWCAAGLFIASHPSVARFLARWGHVVLPVVLVAIGLAILVEGGAFGL